MKIFLNDRTLLLVTLWFKNTTSHKSIKVDVSMFILADQNVIQAYLWFKSVEVANKEAEEQDRRDGYM